MRIVVGLVMCALVGACSLSGEIGPATGEEPTGEAARDEPDFTPENPCEDLCYEIYLAQCANCLLLPKSRRQACYAKAADDLATCLKKCAGQ